MISIINLHLQYIKIISEIQLKVKTGGGLLRLSVVELLNG